MEVERLPDEGLQDPNRLFQHMQLMLQTMMLSKDDELVRAYKAIVKIFNNED